MKTENRRNEPVAEVAPVARDRCLGPIPQLALVSSLCPRLVAAASEPAAEGTSALLAPGVLIAIGTLALAALGVTGVTSWSRKQDHMREMVSFCMRFLIDSRHASEGREAAAALGGAKDPRAMLVLLDVMNDQQAEETVRAAAEDALGTMAGGYRKLRQLINDLRSAGARSDHAKLIELLIENFEKRGEKYVQTAYVVGRAYMRQGHYADAKEWFRIAELRNRHTPFYGNRIRELIIDCEQRLFAKGDELFKAGQYHEAKERYSAASHGLDEEESARYSVFLRLACAYCKLGDYEDADQAVLQALKYGQETDMSLALNKLLRQVLDHKSQKPAPLRQRLIGEIDHLVTGIMAKLGPQETERAAPGDAPGGPQ